MTTVLSEFPYPNQWVGHVGRAIQNAHNAKQKELKVGRDAMTQPWRARLYGQSDENNGEL